MELSESEPANANLQGIVKRMLAKVEHKKPIKSEKINCITDDCQLLTAKMGKYESFSKPIIIEL